jgi:hypothetical protein
MNKAVVSEGQAPRTNALSSQKKLISSPIMNSVLNICVLWAPILTWKGQLLILYISCC